MTDVLVPDPRVWKEFGVTPMTGWRWTNDPELGFPPRIKINNRNYRSRAALDAFKATLRSSYEIRQEAHTGRQARSDGRPQEKQQSPRARRRSEETGGAPGILSEAVRSVHAGKSADGGVIRQGARDRPQTAPQGVEGDGQKCAILNLGPRERQIIEDLKAELEDVRKSRDNWMRYAKKLSARLSPEEEEDEES